MLFTVNAPPDDVQRIRIRLVNNIKIIQPDFCWEWQGFKTKEGYAQSFIYTGGSSRTVAAHRLSYESFREPIAEGLVIDHLCRKLDCINPEHLEPVTVRENTRRGVGEWAKRGKKTHCKNGHPFTPLNTKFLPSKGRARICRECSRIGNRKYRQRIKDATI